MGLSLPSSKSYLANLILRFLQLIFAVTVIGLYAQDLDAARKAGKYADSKWAYATAVGALSALAAILYMVPMIYDRSWSFVVDAFLFLMWIIVFGIFGKMYINEDPEGNSGIQRMKNAVWIDLVNMLLWLVSLVAMTFKWWRIRTGRTQFTGRAVV